MRIKNFSLVIVFISIQLLTTALRDNYYNESYNASEPVLVQHELVANNSSRQYDFLYFVQQWEISLCNVRPCIKPARPVFRIYGLRPSSYSGQTLNCRSSTATSFDPNKISDVKSELEREWPSLVHEEDEKVWEEEWENYGICSESLLNQHAFFEAALNLKHKYNLISILADKDIYPFGSVCGLDNITNAIKSGTGYTPQIGCNLYKKIPMLSNIFLCFDYNATSIIDCPLIRRCNHDAVFFPLDLFQRRSKNINRN